MTTPTSSVRLSRVLAGSFVSQGAAGVLRLVVPAIVARAIGPKEFGAYAALTVMVLIVFNLGNLGLSSATTHRTARPEGTNNTLVSALVLSMALGLASMVAVLVLDATWLGESGMRWVAVLAYASLPAVFVLNGVGGMWLGAQRFRAFNAQLLGLQVALTVFTLALLWIARSLASAVAAWTLAYLVAAGASLVVLARSGELKGGRASARESRALADFGIRTHLSTLVTFLSYRLDVLLVVGFLGTTAGGYYMAAVAVAETIWFFSQVASTVLFARVSRGSDVNREREQHELVTRIITFVSIAAAVLVAIAAPRIVNVLYSEEFSPAVPVLRVLLIATVALSVSRMFANYIAAVGHPGRNVWGSVAGLVVNVSLNVVLIPRMGMIGAAWASAVSYGLTLVSRLVEYARLAGADRVVSAVLVRAGDFRMLISILKRRG